jgi:hypothetical protein
MRTTIHAAAAGDPEVVADAVANARAVGGDSGRALLDHIRARALTRFCDAAVSKGILRGEWVAAPGTGGAGAPLYLHGRADSSTTNGPVSSPAGCRRRPGCRCFISTTGWPRNIPTRPRSTTRSPRLKCCWIRAFRPTASC